MSAASSYSLSMQIAELQAELRVRRRTYPGLVSRGRMRASEAETKIACMEAAVASLQRQMSVDCEASASRQIARNGS